MSRTQVSKNSPAKKKRRRVGPATPGPGEAPDRLRRYAFTVNTAPENISGACGLLSRLYERGQCSYICYQKEICPKTRREHVQGYVEFTDGRSISAAGKAFHPFAPHFEKARGSPSRNRGYCSKPGTVLHPKPDFSEFGTISVGQGSRSDLEGVRESLRGGVTGLDLWDRHFTQCVKYHRAFDRYQQLLQSQERATYGPYLPKKTTYLCGPTGSGKTSRALDICIRKYGFANVYVRPSTQGSSTDWFEGLEPHHRAMIIDEFGSDIKYRNLLRLLDGYPHMVELKGRSQSVDNILEIFITSNYAPHEIYPNISGSLRNPLYRRITHYQFMDRWSEKKCPMPHTRTNELRTY